MWPSWKQENTNLLEVADRDEASTWADSEFVFLGAPFDAGGGTIDAQQHQSMTPCAVGLKIILFSDINVELQITTKNSLFCIDNIGPK